MSVLHARSNAIFFVVAIGLMAVAAFLLLAKRGAPSASPPHRDEGVNQFVSPSSVATVERHVVPSQGFDGRSLRVIVNSAQGAVRKAQLLRLGSEGMMASPTADLLCSTGDDGVCRIQLHDVRDTGFGVVAPGYQAQFITSERLSVFGGEHEGEILILLQPATRFTVACVDPCGVPVPSCRVMICRSGALSWAVNAPDEASWALDAANGQHVVWSDEKGLALVDGLAPTTYYLRVEKEGLCATNAGSSSCLVVPPGSITVTMAPIEVVRAVVNDGGAGYLSRLTSVRNSEDRVSSLGALDAAQRQKPELAGERFWATLDLAGGRVPVSETLTVLFANGSEKVVELPYQPLANSTAVTVEPGPAQPTFDVAIEVASSLRSSLSIGVRVARLGDSGSSPGRNEFEVAASLHAPCKLTLPRGIYSVTVPGVDGKWFERKKFEVSADAVTVRLESNEPLVPVTFRREVPSGYLHGLWNIRFGTSGHPLVRRQCTPAEIDITILAPVGDLHYTVRAPGLADLDASTSIGAAGVVEIVLRQRWE